MTAASAAVIRLVGQRGHSPGGCDETHLTFVRAFGGLPRLRALPRLDPETRTPDRQNCPGGKYRAGGFTLGLAASLLGNVILSR